MNKDTRKILADKYLKGDTDSQEELMLARWFASHEAGPEERPFSGLILSEHPEAAYATGECEYDSIMASYGRRGRVIRWICGVAAGMAVLIGLWIFMPDREPCGFNGLEIAQGIERIMSLDMENVERVTAVPQGSKVIVTAIMHDGSKCSYIMSKDGGTDALSITAMK